MTIQTSKWSGFTAAQLEMIYNGLKEMLTNVQKETTAQSTEELLVIGDGYTRGSYRMAKEIESEMSKRKEILPSYAI